MHPFYFILAMILFYTAHSILADDQIKAWLTNHWISNKYYRITYNIIAILLIIPLIWVYLNTEKWPIFNSGLFNQIFGGTMILSSFWLTQKAMAQYSLAEFMGWDRLTADRMYDQKPTLNTEGLNQWVRHPLYFASLITIWGGFLLFPNSNLLIIALITSAYLPFGIYFEEKKLVRVFGEAYKRYQKEVPMIIPWPRKPKPNKTVK